MGKSTLNVGGKRWTKLSGVGYSAGCRFEGCASYFLDSWEFAVILDADILAVSDTVLVMFSQWSTKGHPACRENKKTV